MQEEIITIYNFNNPLFVPMLIWVTIMIGAVIVWWIIGGVLFRIVGLQNSAYRAVGFILPIVLLGAVLFPFLVSVRKEGAGDFNKIKISDNNATFIHTWLGKERTVQLDQIRCGIIESKYFNVWRFSTSRAGNRRRGTSSRLIVELKDGSRLITEKQSNPTGINAHEKELSFMPLMRRLIYVKGYWFWRKETRQDYGECSGGK